MENTALRAEKNEYSITFRNTAHEEFYYRCLKKCHRQDVYRKALIYCLGIDRDTRENVERVYDFETGLIKPKCINEGWQTSGSQKIVRMAFNLFHNGTPTVALYKKADQRLGECQCYSVEDLFCCSYAPYFWEAIKIRYPEYCFG